MSVLSGEDQVIYGVRKRFTSYNPVSAHFDWMHSMWKDARLADSWWDKIRIWFMPTGWRPEDVMLKDPRQKFSKASYEKFDAERGRYPFRLALMLFIILAAANHTLMLQSESLSWQDKGIMAALIIVGLLWLGRLLNDSRRNGSGSV